MAAATAVSGAALSGTPAAPQPARAALATPAGVPLSFEANVGQADPAVRFLAHGPRGTLWLARSEAVFALRGRGDGAQDGPDVLRMRLLGARPGVTVSGAEPRAATANYLVGDRPSRWQRHVPTYGRVVYRGVYRGIDLAYHAAGGRLEYDFAIAPGADPGAIGIGLRGARTVRLDGRGRLHAQLAHSALVQDAPQIYQERAGIRRAVSGRYVLRGGHRVGFAVDAYDRRAALVIDPKIAYSTYLGGSANDVGTAIAVDRRGNAYVTGSTSSADLPQRGGLRSRRGRPINAFVAKLDPAGRLVYTTYLGGSAYTDGRGIAVDRAGHAYVTGATGSADFPTRRAAQPDYGGKPFDAYVTKLAVSGSEIIYSTYNGGPRNDRGYAIAVDTDGTVVATGRTAHDSFPTVGRLPVGPEGGAFVTKISPSGRRFVYSTVLGGHDPVNSSNTGFGVAIGPHASAYVTGITAAHDFPTVRPFQARYGGGRSNAFVTRLDARGRIAYSTYLGGSAEDEGLAIAVDGRGRAYVTGHASSPDFPVVGPARPAATGANAFVTKLDGSGARLVYSGLLGGGGDDTGHAIAVDASGHAHVTGVTTSADFPTTLGTIQPQLAGSSDAFVTTLDRAGSTFVFSTYLGGAGAEAGLGIARHAGSTYVTGQTGSADFPALRPAQRAPGKRPATAGGGGSAFVTKLSLRPAR